MIINGSSVAYGKFWVPGNESNACLGVLLINNDGTAYLFAFFHDDQKYVMPFFKDGDTEKIDAIFGSLYAPINNEAPYVALLDNVHLLYQDIPQEIRNKVNVPFPDFISYRVEKTLNKLRTYNIDNNYVKAEFSISGLVNWFKLDKHVNYDDNDDEFNIKFKKPTPIEIKLPKSLKLIFKFNFCHSSCVDHKYQQKFNLGIYLVSKNPLSYDYFLKIICTIQLFFCFNSDCILDIKGPIKLYDGTNSYHLAELITEGNWSNVFPLTAHPAFNFSCIKDRFEIIMQKWIDFTRETYPSIFYYLENREDSTKYITTKYLMAWQAVESLGKTLHINKKCKMRDSINRLTLKNNKDIHKDDKLEYFYFPKFFSLISENEWDKVVDVLCNTRNIQAHTLDRDKIVLYEDNLDLGISVLELIYQVNVFGALGFSDYEIYMLIKNNDHLKAKVNAIYKIIAYLNSN